MNSSLDIKNESSTGLENHGERMVPGVSDGCTFWEHVYRYAFACRFVGGKRVLDIACGEGYGAAALRKAGAARVVGVDISEEACRHACNMYGLDAKLGTAEEIPLPAASLDVVVSFETIEHVRDPGCFLDECARVLVLGGDLIISTPNKSIYARPGTVPNPHHCSEMIEEEFTSALRARFHIIRVYTQRPYSVAWWSPRVLASDRTLRIRGFGRLRRLAQSVLFPNAAYEPTAGQRRGVVEEILAATRRHPSPLNPYAVRPRLPWNREEPMYFVAHTKRLN